MLEQNSALNAFREATSSTQYAGKMWLVGGCVRDALMGIAPKNDFDIVMEEDVLSVVQDLRKQGVFSFEPVVYPRFGTAMVRYQKVHFEFVTARRESYEDGPRKPEVEPATLLEDARRRDFTANSLMENLHTGELLDLLGNGLSDLKSGILRTPLNSVETMRDDPLRILRAIRFRAQLGFEYAEELEQALISEVKELAKISAERQRDELTKMLQLPRAVEALADCKRFGVLAVILPEFEAMGGVEQGRYHHLDVWEHTLLVIQNAQSRDLILNLACLFHDVGKPPTRFVDDDGNTRFFGHDSMGAKMTVQIMRRLKFSTEEIEAVSLLVRHHMRIGTAGRFSPTAARRVVRDLGDQLARFLDLIDADASALRPGVRVLDLSPIRKLIEEVSQQTPAIKLRSPLSGEEVMALLGIPQGVQVGEAMRYLTGKVIEGELDPDDREKAKTLLLGR